MFKFQLWTTGSQTKHQSTAPGCCWSHYMPRNTWPHIHTSPLTSQFSCQLILATWVRICYLSTVHYQVFPGLYFCTQQNVLTIPLTWYTQLPNKQIKKKIKIKKDIVYAINCHLSFLLACFLAILVWMSIPRKSGSQSECVHEHYLLSEYRQNTSSDKDWEMQEKTVG